MQESEQGDETPVTIWLEELIANARRDDVNSLHFEIFKGDGRVRQRTGSGMSLVASDIPPKRYAPLIWAIQTRFNIDPHEMRRPQDGVDDFGLRAAMLPTANGKCCCISFQYQHQDYKARLKTEPSDTATIQTVLEKRHGLVFLHQKNYAYGLCWMILEMMTEFFDGGKVLFAPDRPLKNIAPVPKVQYSLPCPNKSLRHEWFQGLVQQQPDAMFLPYGQFWPTAELCHYAEDHLVFVETESRSFLYDMKIPESWLRKHCQGMLMANRFPRICQHCRQQYVPSANELQELNLSSSRPVEFSRGAGCEQCYQRRIKGTQLSLAVAADADCVASIFSAARKPDFDFWASISQQAIRHRNAQLVKDGLVASHSALLPRYGESIHFNLDNLA